MGKTVIVNRMFTGNYLEQGKNIGHEIINLFRPDAKNGQEQPVQIYLMSGGDYSYSRYQEFFGKKGEDQNIEAILFSRSIDSNCIEITAKATGIKPVFIPTEKWKGEYSAIEIRNLAKEKLAQKTEWWEKLPQRTKTRRLKKLECKEEILKNALNKLVVSVDELHKDLEIDSKRKEWKELADLFLKLADCIQDGDTGEKEKKDYAKGRETKSVVYRLSKAIRFRAMHIKQMAYIIEKDIRYKGVRLDKLYQGNTEAKDGIAIYVTFTAESVVKAKQPLYIVTADKYKRKETFNAVVKKDRVSGSSSATYYEYSGDIEKLIKDDKNEYWESEEIKEVEKQLEDLTDNFNFVAMLGKEDDELAFSNMFAYFFRNDENFFKTFSRDILGIDAIETAIELGVNAGSFEKVENVEREHRNIDLLITGQNYAIVIENKIKSGINGEKHDIYGKVVGNQLDKYYKYVEENYTDKKIRKYFLFSPKYNCIDTDKFKSEAQKEFKIIYYNEIYKFCSKYFKENSADMDKDMRFYFEQFVKALAKHAKDKDSDHENISLIRMRDIVDKIQIQN